MLSYRNSIGIGLLFVFLSLTGVGRGWAGESVGWDSLARAAQHAIEYTKPAVIFLEGGVLGNGAMGLVVCTRPDAVMIRFGHNEVWDIRMEEIPMGKLGTFGQVWNKIKQSKSDPAALKWLEEYCRMTGEPYRKEYPRPWPCGSLVLGFDRRHAELLSHRVRLQDGVCEVRFLVEGREARLEICPEMERDRLWLRMVDTTGRPIPGPFDLALIIPEGELPAAMAQNADSISFRRVHSPLKPDQAQDRALRLTARLSGRLAAGRLPAEPNFQPVAGPFVAVVELNHGPAKAIPAGAAELPRPTASAAEAAYQATRQSWRTYWSRSGVALADQELEAIWYRNLYFLNCVTRPGVACPGSLGNWSFGKIGSAWHSDYHTNYNIQQPFWGTFSTNHVDKHEPYVELVHFLLPLSRRWARDFYNLPGAYFPHSSYPLAMTVPPYPVPPLSLEVCEPPWTVQSLWWHYLYTLDKTYLKEKMFGPIREAVVFLNAYMRRPEAHGPASPFKDNRYHIYPTQSPEIFYFMLNPFSYSPNLWVYAMNLT